MSESGIVTIEKTKNVGGKKVKVTKEYKTVALRVSLFREEFPINERWGIFTEIIHDDGKRVVVQASITNSGEVVATGLAEEVRGSSYINETSALENAETSAIGRALAAAGYAGEEYASADELLMALRQEKLQEVEKQAQAKLQEIEQTIYGEVERHLVESITKAAAPGDFDALATFIGLLPARIKTRVGPTYKQAMNTHKIAWDKDLGQHIKKD